MAEHPFALKPLSKDGLPSALDKAERYRLLNESREAESICLDVLEIEPDNQRALITLVLALTDQFDRGVAGAVDRARAAVKRLADPYAQAYYGGITHEREAKARLKRGGHHASSMAYHGLREAMAHYERAEALRPPGNDDAILRWNTCVRILRADSSLAPHEAIEAEPVMLE